MPGVDPDQLDVHPLAEAGVQLARVGDTCYWNDEKVSEQEFAELLRSEQDT